MKKEKKEKPFTMNTTIKFAGSFEELLGYTWGGKKIEPLKFKIGDIVTLVDKQDSKHYTIVATKWNKRKFTILDNFDYLIQNEKEHKHVFEEDITLVEAKDSE